MAKKSNQMSLEEMVEDAEKRSVIMSGLGEQEFEEEEDEDPAECGYRPIKGDLDLFDRDRNPVGGIREQSGFMNKNQIHMDWDAQERKDGKKSKKIPRKR